MLEKRILFNQIYTFLFVILYSLIVLILSNVIFDNTAYYILRTIFVLPFILFLSGFPLIYLIFEEKIEFSELIILSIGMSISIVILNAMIIHFILLPINVTNILNSISITTIIIVLINILKSIIILKKRSRIIVIK